MCSLGADIGLVLAVEVGLLVRIVGVVVAARCGGFVVAVPSEPVARLARCEREGLESGVVKLPFDLIRVLSSDLTGDPTDWRNAWHAAQEPTVKSVLQVYCDDVNPTLLEGEQLLERFKTIEPNAHRMLKARRAVSLITPGYLGDDETDEIELLEYATMARSPCLYSTMPPDESGHCSPSAVLEDPQRGSYGSGGGVEEWLALPPPMGEVQPQLVMMDYLANIMDKIWVEPGDLCQLDEYPATIHCNRMIILCRGPFNITQAPTLLLSRTELEAIVAYRKASRRHKPDPQCNEQHASRSSNTEMPR